MAAPSLSVGALPYRRWFFIASAAAGFGVAVRWLAMRRRRRLLAAAEAVRRALQEVDSPSRAGELKMVLVVRRDLKMGTGKIAAQCCHAAVGVVERVLAAAPSDGAVRPHPRWAHRTPLDPQIAAQWVRWYEQWRERGCAKIALRLESTERAEEELLDLSRAAADAMLPSYVVVDAGRTQIRSGSKTVLAVGPAPVERVDAVTKHLKLL
eukprot:TRINITY_DN50329_c0_g1_i1.p1 TRINITY_DN50329_c0_g1~~TRINITY_DN50329_c0_g1_i1.p1  ORF type:complete len:236 (+),score=85.50 TRINITY_DN50329_c0_g1_i1:82-708(+)